MAGEGAVPLRTPVYRWGAGLRAGTSTPPTQQGPEVVREAATAEIPAVTAPDLGARDLVVTAFEATTAEARDLVVNGPLVAPTEREWCKTVLNGLS